MDWFRNVPNVIRSSSVQSDHSNGSRNNSVSDERSYGNPNEESNFSASRPTKFERKASKDENNQNRFMMSQSLQNSSSSKKSSVREELTCALCGEMYSDPRILPCLHSFCRRCLEHTVNPRSTTLTCHLCRKRSYLKGIIRIFY